MVARYRIEESTEIDGRRTRLQQWRTETYALRDGRWTLVAGADIVIPADPAVAVVDRERLADYVGQYEYTPGSVDTVTLEAGRLFVQNSREPRVELFAENESTFFARGEPWRLRFVRDAGGSVTSLVFVQQGQEFVARRLVPQVVG